MTKEEEPDTRQLTKEEMEENKILEPIAKSIFRDLQESHQAEEDGTHINSDHVLPAAEVGQGCNDPNLTENEKIHCNAALEQDGDDSDGDQGGQQYRPPTNPPSPKPTSIPTASPTSVAPTASPTSVAPTVSPSVSSTDAPSFHPSLRGDPWVLRGTVYYDRNANGKRDSNVDTSAYGMDVEYNYGLGGVSIHLVECDEETNMGLDENEATAVSRGYDVLMHPQLVGREEAGGTYRLVDIRINRSYYIWATAPNGYLLSGDVCNDQFEDWKCSYTAADVVAKGQSKSNSDARGGGGGRRTRLLRGPSPSLGSSSSRNLNGANAIPQGYQPAQAEYVPPSEEELGLGLREGRSKKCVSVDRTGMPDSHLDVGVMRVGDVAFGDTNVELNLSLLPMPNIDGSISGGRSLMDVIQERVLERVGGGIGEPVLLEDGTLVYALKQEDKDAIGIVTSEVLASAIHESLNKKGVVLDNVRHSDVLYFAPKPEVEETEDKMSNITAVEGDIADGEDSSTTTSEAARSTSTRDSDAPRDTTSAVPTRNTNSGKLSVELVVRGHYNRGTSVDFDYIVQDSINRDTNKIRRELTYYNQNCRDQNVKVADLGFTLDDFVEIHTNRGVKKPANQLGLRQQQQGQQNPNLVTDDKQAFSAACNQMRVLPEYFEASLGGLNLKAKAKPVTYTVNEGGASMMGAIIGVIIAVALLAIGAGYFLFQRGLKKKKEKRREARVTHVLAASSSAEDDIDSVDEKIRKFDSRNEKIHKFDSRTAKEEKKMAGKQGSSSISARDNRLVPVNSNEQQPQQSRKGLAGMVQREMANVAAAISSERQRLAGGSAERRGQTWQTGASDPQERLENNMSGHRGGEGGAETNINASVKSGSRGEEAMEGTTRFDGSITSRNIVPNIVKVDFEDESESSSSSSDDDSDSSSSSSSSSSEDSESSSRRKARKRSERRAGAKSKGCRQSKKKKKANSKNGQGKGTSRRDSRRRSADLV